MLGLNAHSCRAARSSGRAHRLSLLIHPGARLALSTRQRCRMRLSSLRKVVEEEKAIKRAAERAARRAARTGAPAPSIDLTPLALTSRRAARRAARAEEKAEAGGGLAERGGGASSAAQPARRKRARGGGRQQQQQQARGARKALAEDGRVHRHDDEYRQAIPVELLAWGCDAELWGKVKNKNALRRLAKAGDEEHGRRRVASLRERFAGEQQ